MIGRMTAGIGLMAAVAAAATLLSLGGACRAALAAPGPVIAHSAGQISRAAAIRVVFGVEAGTGNVFPRPLDSAPFQFSPAIAGQAVWVNARTLEFRPRQDLDPGQTYQATLRLSSFMETIDAADTFSFDFSVIRQSLEITVEGFDAADPKDPRRQRFSGHLTTADVADADRVEKVLTIALGKRPVAIDWEHGQGRKAHRFSTGDLARTGRDTPLVMTWDGAPIGAAQKGRQAVVLPAAGTFEVVTARAVQTAESMVEIRMTDPLEGNQDLRGLVTVDGQEVRTDSAGNRLSVYLPKVTWGEVSVSLGQGIRSAGGRRLGRDQTVSVFFGEVKPQARFVGKAVIVPTTLGLTVPVETANLRRITVSAIRIPVDRLPQFLQVSTLAEDDEIRRVGRVVWKRTLDLNWQPEMKNRWVRHGLDLSELIRRNPGGMFRLTLSFAYQDVDFGCAGGQDYSALFAAAPPVDEDADADTESSYWDNAAQAGGYQNWNRYYENRENPCHPAYYMRLGDHDITAARNVLISDIGLIVKRGDGPSVRIVATDIRSAAPLAGAAVDLLNYPQEVLASAVTDARGMALLNTEAVPFLAVARHQGQWGFLRLDDGSANSLSHFDVAGQAVKKGLKGFLYGERGVWRPGDTLYLTFILEDSEKRLPADHPVRFDLFNPTGQLVRTLTRTASLNGFYDFTTTTADDAPTGNWLGRVSVGGATFEQRLKIETVMPNRLKIALDFGADPPVLKDGPVTGRLTARWLHGAPANRLKADMEMELRPAKTAFAKYAAYTFDDPVRRFRPERFDVYKGTLDEKGNAGFSKEITAANDAPGMLNAQFYTRVFEPSGAFSTDVFSAAFHPYERYVGVRLPAGDAAREMLLTDTDHTVNIVLVDWAGRPVPEGQVKVEVFKLKWRWWWEKAPEDIADYVGTTAFSAIDSGEVDIRGGAGKWRLRIDNPEWGRYLVRVSDPQGGHITGKIVYMDWPGWAGRGQKEIPGGASVLSFSSDKTEYRVGEPITLTIPAAHKGRGLVSLEKGARVLGTEWVEGGEGTIRYTVTATAEMAPTVYAHVTYLQPHMTAGNDLPIRLYGVVPIRVVDPQTRLAPVIGTPEAFAPEGAATVTVGEAAGKPMTYTLAIVDEGLLDLTRFSTPDPWEQFHRREALGVKTWDLFDEVAGAYGGMLEQLLAVGGGASEEAGGRKKARRFPPMVRFAGPFYLEAGAVGTHVIDIPQYIGSVRVMVVAGGGGRAFGFADKAVAVKKPLMLLGTLPRVISPGEEILLPVSVFALASDIGKVAVSVVAEGALAVVGEASREVAFSDIGDQMTAFRLRAGGQPGPAVVRIAAAAGDNRAAHRIDIDIRPVTSPVVTLIGGEIAPGAALRQDVRLPGIAGTNTLSLEVSSLPAMQLGHRISSLVRYPHGCLEQTVSAAFPQLYLGRLMAQSPAQRNAVAENVQGGIDKLGRFLSAGGGFVYWPGGREVSAWADIYTGHFLIEAEKAGYLVPVHLKQTWTGFNRRLARNWVTGPPQAGLEQAYRLYVLALAGAPEMGAMNRLRESQQELSTAARWRLAAAYSVAGQPEAAADLIKGLSTAVAEYAELSGTFGSALRDKAMILDTLCLMDRMAAAEPLAREIGEALGADVWYSTQTTAVALIALARYAGVSGDPAPVAFTYRWDTGEAVAVSQRQAMVERIIDPSRLGTGGAIEIRNDGDRTLFSQVVARGNPAPGRETAAESGLSMTVNYVDLKGEPVDIARLTQGTDLVVEVRVKNTGKVGTCPNLALSHLFPAGWEIRNVRPEGGDGNQPADGATYRDVRDDRILVYFDLDQGGEILCRTQVNASYIGRFYLPAVSVAAMYDERIHARVPGRWIEVAAP